MRLRKMQQPALVFPQSCAIVRGALAAACRYDPGHVCNQSDDAGRYSFQAQPEMCRWNCEKLAEALAPVLTPSRARNELAIFDQEYDRCARSVGLHQAVPCSAMPPHTPWIVCHG